MAACTLDAECSSMCCGLAEGVCITSANSKACVSSQSIRLWAIILIVVFASAFIVTFAYCLYRHFRSKHSEEREIGQIVMPPMMLNSQVVEAEEIEEQARFSMKRKSRGSSVSKRGSFNQDLPQNEMVSDSEEQQNKEQIRQNTF